MADTNSLPQISCFDLGGGVNGPHAPSVNAARGLGDIETAVNVVPAEPRPLSCFFVGLGYSREVIGTRMVMLCGNGGAIIRQYPNIGANDNARFNPEIINHHEADNG